MSAKRVGEDVPSSAHPDSQPPDASSDAVFYWSWRTRQRGAVVIALVGAAATSWTILGWCLYRPLLQWRTFLGGTSFLAIPMLVGFLLFVGLRTDIMPQRGNRVSRADHPVDFWFTAGLYAALIAVWLGSVLYVAVDAWRSN